MDPLPLSALNHLLYCSRRAYLIHAEGTFVHNEHTILGDLAHAHVDTPGFEQRAGWELLRALPLFSDALGLTGKADLVEIRWAEGGNRDSNSSPGARKRAIAEVRPVEYKKGPKRRWGNDEVQLCAQALCLEEMFSLTIECGAIFHAQSQRRTDVSFDATLRACTVQAIADLRSLLARHTGPAAELKPQCEGCSLHEVCLPEAAGQRAPALFEPRSYP